MQTQQTVLITGGGAGLSLAIAERLCRDMACHVRVSGGDARFVAVMLLNGQGGTCPYERDFGIYNCDFRFYNPSFRN